MKKPKRNLFVLIFALVFLVVFTNFSIKQGINQIGRTDIDFPAFYYASTLVFQENISPYPPANWNLVEDNVGQELWPYVYPPPSLLLFAPLNLLSYDTAKIAFLAMNHLLTIFIAYMLFYRLFKVGNLLYWLIGLSYLYLFFPLAITISSGQINLVVLSLILLFWYALKQELHPALIALPLTLAIVLKVYPLIFLLFLVLKKEYKALLWVFIFLGLAVVFSLGALPSGLWIDWKTYILNNGYGERVLRVLLPGSVANQSINGFTSRLFIGRNLRIDILFPNPRAAVVVPYLLSGVVLLITFALLLFNQAFMRKEKQPNKRSIILLDWEISLLLIAMYLVAPFSWDHHLVFLLPAIYVAFFSLLSMKKWHIYFIPLSIVGLVLASNYPFAHPRFQVGIYTLLISVKFYMVLLLWAIFCVYLGIGLKDAINKKRLNDIAT